MEKSKLVYSRTPSLVPEAKQFFTERSIPFTYIDYDLADEATQGRILQELDAAGATGFRFVRIGDKVIAGYQPELYRRR